MIGCMALATTTDIDLDEDEMAAAVWFTRDEVAKMIQKSINGEAPTPDSPVCPGPNAMAHHLLSAFAGGFGFDGRPVSFGNPKL